VLPASEAKLTEAELLRKMALAIKMSIIHWRAFRSFTEGLRNEGSVDIAAWEQMIRDWEQDPSKPSPYEFPEEREWDILAKNRHFLMALLFVAVITLAKIKNELSIEEHNRAASAGGADASLLEVTPSSFIITGLEIEETQYVISIIYCPLIFNMPLCVFRLAIQVLSRKRKKTLVQETELQTRRTALLKTIQKFRNHQAAYMPGLITHLNSIGFKEPSEALSKPEAMQLFLPSHFIPHVRQAVCSETIVDIEVRLRKGQLSEALSGLRRQLRARMFASKLKNKNGNGQLYWLRSNTFITQVNSRLREHQRIYDSARRAMEHLDPDGSWARTYRKLEEKDIRGINEKEVEADALKRAAAAAGMDDNGTAGTNEGDDDDDDDDTLLDLPIQPLADPRSVMGEGNRTISWIWTTYAEGELGESKAEIEQGVPNFYADNSFWL
jgi:hypothetical protein